MKSKKQITIAGNIFWKNSRGELHREDGPAIEWNDGDKGWFLGDMWYSEEEWKREIVKMNLAKLI